MGTVFALGNLLLVLMLLALGHSRATTVGWILALAVSAVWILVAPLQPTATVVIAFLIAEVGAFVLLLAAVEWEAPRTRSAGMLRAASDSAGP